MRRVVRSVVVSNSSLLPLGAVGLVLGLAVASPGCEAADIAKECGLDIDCENGGFAEGKASISGIASIDAFFGAAIDLDASLRGLSGELRAELDAIAVSVGAQPGATGAEISARLEEHLAIYVTGGLQVQYAPPKCTANIEASVAAAAECDATVDPGSVTVRCEGSCAAEAGVDFECEGDATLMCTGTAPSLECSGTCSGSCAVEVSAMLDCDGTCRGSCTVEGSTMDGFEGRCAGECDGECVTEMSAGAMCSGKCEGQCEYQAPEGGCEASASARCEASAGAAIECDAGCEGSAEPPEVSAECEASVEAKADASLECTPPSLDIGFEWGGEARTNLQLQADFRAWLEGFRAHFGVIVALRAKAGVIGDSAGKLIIAADAAVKDSFDDLEANGSLRASIGAACAVKELPVAVDALVDSSGSLTAEVEASASVLATVGG